MRIIHKGEKGVKGELGKMQIDNFFQMNDWKIDKFLDVICILQILVLILIGLNVPILRELVSLIYLLIVPGILILRILRMHKLGSVQTLLYTVGLSIASLMFLGFFLNLLGPLVGVNDPISLLPLIATVTLYVVILSWIAYVRDKDYDNPDFLDPDDLLAPSTLAIVLLPFLVVFGTYLMNLYRINILLVLFFFILGFIVILFAYDRIPRKVYPFLIFTMSVSILFQTSLISSYVSGWDIQYEYYLAELVMNNSYWFSNFNYVVNSMLSVTILAPILSIIPKRTLSNQDCP